MQHIQTLVLRGNGWWIGGLIPREKLAPLVLKMATRYPITRSERGRVYDRSKEMATCHFLAFPTDQGKVVWWLLSSEGVGGLADPKAADHHVRKHAMAADGHIHFQDYVLLYAHKKDARVLTDARTGKEKRVIKDCSSWTWKITVACYRTLVIDLEQKIVGLEYGDDTCATPYGVRGLLAYQRRRPLFSGVRTQILILHREALSQWGRVRMQWLSRNTWALERYGEQRAGQLRSLAEITSQQLPKMMRQKVFADPSRTLRALTS
jgi:hypothetical protein